MSKLFVVQARRSMDFMRLKKRSFTMVEILIDLGIISIVAMAVLSAYMYSFKIVSLSKARIAAVVLANEKMENIRNMPYNNVGFPTSTSEFIPKNGVVLPEEQVNRDGINFTVETLITFVDDPFDGCGTTNNETTVECKKSENSNSQQLDPFEYDYKNVEVRISQNKNNKTIVLAQLSSKLSTSKSNGAQLDVCVRDSQGVLLADAKVTVKNAVLPGYQDIVMMTRTDNCTKIDDMIPVTDYSYQIVVSKSGYNGDQTFPVSSTNPNPVNPNVNVTDNQVTTVNFTLEKSLGSIKLNLRDADGNIFTPDCNGSEPQTATISEKDQWEQGTNANIEYDNPSGDISIKNKDVIHTPIDLKFIYNQVPSRVYSNVAVNTYNRPYVVDGDDLTYWQAKVVQTQKVHVPAYWRMDLGQSYDITRLQIKFAQDKFKVEWAPNDANYDSMWTQVGIDADTIAIGQELASPISMRYIKITNTSDVPTDLDIINELALFRSIAAATHITAVTQIDSGLNSENDKKIRQWQSFKPNEEDSDYKNSNNAFDGTFIYYSFRYSDTGGSSDSSWTSWSPPVSYRGINIGLRQTLDYQKRYLQVRTDFVTSTAGVSPILHDYTISYTTCKTGSGSYEYSLPFVITSTRNSSDPVYDANNILIKPAVPRYKYDINVKSESNPSSLTLIYPAVWGYYNIVLNASKPAASGWRIVATKQMQSVYKDPNTELVVDIYVTQDNDLPAITNITPNNIIMPGNTTIVVTGSNFSADNKILIKNSNATIEGTNIQLVDDNNIQADFNLSGAAPGLWDVVVMTSQGKKTTQFGGQYNGPSGANTIISGLLIK